jgi:hypothetical protein
MQRIETISSGEDSAGHPELGTVDSTISGSPKEPAALDAAGSMTSDLLNGNIR